MRSFFTNFFSFCLLMTLPYTSLFGQKNLVKTILTEASYCDLDYYKLVFEDKFDGNSLDTNKWYTFYPYGENERKDSCSFCRTHVSANVYKDENCVVSDGLLKLYSDTATIDWFGKRYFFSSAMIHSKAIFKTYGRYEISCKLPKGQHQWPAFWIFGWNTEIDIFEFICKGTEKLEMSIHKWLSNDCPNDNPSSGAPCYSNRSKTVDFDIDFSEDFHQFTMEYEAHVIKFYIDGIMVRVVPKYYTLKKKPIYNCVIPPGEYYVDPAFPIYGEPVQVIANQSICRKHKEKNPVFPNVMSIDYIRVLQKTIQEDFIEQKQP
ncbi:MAG: glycoside hydrolase family 16 protein [Saprospiraceae bacterium]